MRFEPRTFATSDGLDIAFRDYPAVGRLSGPPILCLHGLTRNARDFEELAPRLAALGRRVIVPEQRGRGGSDWDPQPARYTPFVYVADMLELLTALKIRRAVLLGASMGGLMAMLTALRIPSLGDLLRTRTRAALAAYAAGVQHPRLRRAARPELVAGVVLNDVGPKISADALGFIKGYVGREGTARDWDEAIAITRRNEGAGFPDETDPAFWLKMARRAWVETAPGVLERDYDPAIAEPLARARAVDLSFLMQGLADIPTLLVHGALSPLVTPEIMAEMRSLKPDLETVEAPRIGHAPTLTEPAVWPAIERFVSGIAYPRSADAAIARTETAETPDAETPKSETPDAPETRAAE